MLILLAILSLGLTHSLRILWDAHISSDVLSSTLVVPVSFMWLKVGFGLGVLWSNLYDFPLQASGDQGEGKSLSSEDRFCCGIWCAPLGNVGHWETRRWHYCCWDLLSYRHGYLFHTYHKSVLREKIPCTITYLPKSSLNILLSLKIRCDSF